MRRIMLTVLFLLLLTTAACADTTWTEETTYGETVTYTQVDTDWGYILYRAYEFDTEGWIFNFKYEHCIFSVVDEYVSVHDEMTGLQTFYHAEWDGDATLEELVALA